MKLFFSLLIELKKKKEKTKKEAAVKVSLSLALDRNGHFPLKCSAGLLGNMVGSKKREVVPWGCGCSYDRKIVIL